MTLSIYGQPWCAFFQSFLFREFPVVFLLLFGVGFCNRVFSQEPGGKAIPTSSPPVGPSPSIALDSTTKPKWNWNQHGRTVPAATQQFAATVNGSTDQTVTWAVTGFQNGTVDPTGLYSAPTFVPSPATATVTATSTAAPSPGSAFVTVASPTRVGVSQVTVIATAAGGATHSDGVTLTVQEEFSTSV
ncbi:MAG: hypothetical protein WCB11_14655 [Terriglobales bacterium]